MGVLLKRIILLALILMPIISLLESKSPFVLAEDDDDVEDDGNIVEEGTGSEVEETEDADSSNKGSSDVDTIIHFTKPISDGSELPAGKLVEFLVGFTNNGNKDFILDSIDASFRYPMDFNFYIQNFTVIQYHRVVKPRQEATIMYSFYPAEAFAGRPLGLSVNLAYHDIDGEAFTEAVYNQTVNITEVDEGLDGETFFLYVFLLAFAVLLLLAGHHFLSTFKKKEGSAKKNTIETGTKNQNGINYEWIPKELLVSNNNSKLSPKQRTSPRTSPRQRTNQKKGGR